MKIARSLLLLVGALAALSAPAAVQAQNQSRVAVCDRLFSDRCLTVAADGSIATTGGAGGAGGDASAANQTDLNDRVGAISASPAANTLQARLAGINTTISSGLVASASTTTGQLGQLAYCAAVNSAPTRITAQSYPISCDSNGGIRVNFSNTTIGLAAGTADVGTMSPKRATTTRTSGTITTANTFQTVLASNASRLGCSITNTSVNPMTIDVGASPLAATARPLPAGATFDCATTGGVVITDLISLTSATATSTFVVWNQ